MMMMTMVLVMTKNKQNKNVERKNIRAQIFTSIKCIAHCMCVCDSERDRENEARLSYLFNLYLCSVRVAFFSAIIFSVCIFF